MNVRKRSGLMGGEVGSKPSGAVSQREDSVTQAKKIKGTISTPKAIGPQKIKGAVNNVK